MIGGNTPRSIVLSGSPAEMGRRHGQMLGDEIRLLSGQMRRLIFRRVGNFQGIGLRVVAYTLALAMNRHIPPHLKEEMRGIAHGSRSPFLDILVLNCLDDILNILRRLAPRTPSLGCSSFALFGGRSHDGRLIHGRNLDYHFRGTPLDDGGAVSRLLQQQTVLFACHPLGRAAFLSAGWPGLVGVTTAINREGISLGNLTSYLRGTSPDGIPSTLLYRRVLEESASLREVGELLRGGHRTIGNNLMVGSGRENAATLFEITRNTVLEVEPREGMLVATNHFVTRALAQRQRPFLLAHSVARGRRLESLCDRSEITVDQALSFLADVGCLEGENGGSPFARVANKGTAVSVLFRPTEMQLWMGVSPEPPASRGEFRRIDVADLLRQQDSDPANP